MADLKASLQLGNTQLVISSIALLNFVFLRILSTIPKKYSSYSDWKEELGSLYLSDLSPAHLCQVRDKMLNEFTTKRTLRSPSTVNRYLAAFSRALSVAVKEWEWIEENPAFKISKPKEVRGRDRYLSLDEQGRLLAACRSSVNSYLYPIVSIALLTGMRYGEIVKLHWKDINFEMRHITLQETKNGDKRIIPLTDAVVEILKEVPSFGSSYLGLIFVSQKSSSSNPISIRKSFARALKLAEIHSFRFHDLRHTAASYLAMNGATQGELMAILGHRSLQMTRRYAHYSQKHLCELMQRTNNKNIMRILVEHGYAEQLNDVDIGGMKVKKGWKIISISTEK